MRIHQPVNSHEDLLNVLDGLLEELGLDRRDTGGKVTFAGLDPLRPTVLKTGAASAAVAAASAVASAILWRHRGGDGQDIHVDLRKAFAYQSPWQDVLAGCTKLDVIWDLSVKKVDGTTCEFTNSVHTFAPAEIVDFIASQGIPLEIFRAGRGPISEAHNRQETPMFAKSIERHAFRRTPL